MLIQDALLDSLLTPYFLSHFFLRDPSTLTQMRKVAANAAKINEPDHRLIWRPKVRGKWPRHRSVDHLIHAHVSLSLSSVLNASAFLHSMSTLHSSTYSFASSNWRLSFPFASVWANALPTTQGWECVCDREHVSTHDDAPHLARTWCIRVASSAEASAFRCTAPPEFQFGLRRDRIGEFGKHKREKLSVSHETK